jgi:hypothetical protein
MGCDAERKKNDTNKVKGNSLFTPWNRVVLEKLTGFQLVKRFPAFNGI